MLREIVLDTETTGLDPLRGDRLIEIGCVELVNRIPTGREFHRYVNPEREVPREWVGREPIFPWEAKVYALF